MVYIDKQIRRFFFLKGEIADAGIDVEKIEISSFKVSNATQNFLLNHSLKTLKDMFLLNETELCELFAHHVALLKNINGYLKKLIKTNRVEYPIDSPMNCLTKAFQILDNASDSFLDQEVNYFSSARLDNALRKKYRLITFRDLRDFGIVRLSYIENLGKKSYKELKTIIANSYMFFPGASKEDAPAEQKIDSPITNYDYFLEKIKVTVPANIENGCNGVDYNPILKELLIAIFEVAPIILDDRTSEILKSRYINDETLDKIGKGLKLTRERIRQICDKATKKIANSFNNRMYIMQYKDVDNFYGILCNIPNEEIWHYISFSKKMNNIDWIVLEKTLKSLSISNSLIPAYNKAKYEFDRKEAKKREIFEKKQKEEIERIQSTKFTKNDVLVLLAIDELAKANKHTFYKSIHDYIIGKYKTIPNGKYYGCAKNMAIEEMIDIVRKFVDLNIIFRRRQKRGLYYLLINNELLMRSQFSSIVNSCL